jgi:hypothetical protein
MTSLSLLAILLLILAAFGCGLVAHALYGLIFPTSRH